MNIKRAKEEIKNTIAAYLMKDAYGAYEIPPIRQRPVLLMGPPGIGKTQIMEQISQECRVGLVAYTITHHTRQSAIGLPFIQDRIYNSRRCSVTEYTMSEIVASIYDKIADTGLKEGILFIDEINCVSETLAPTMLQFLQCKTFGNHSIPQGWIIVAAGNPPEYNKSVREFDVVTMDRLKVLDVEAEYGIWKEYAQERGIHNVVTSYLELKKEHFYRIETTVKGRSYVTARGWEDLSQILYLYEEEGLAADEALIGQYVRNERVVKEFAAYYDLYNKYKKNYHVEEILDGKAPEEAFIRAKAAAFDERLSLLSMLMDKIFGEMKEIVETAGYLNELMPLLKAVKSLAGKKQEETGMDDKSTGGGEKAGVSVLADMLEKQAEAKKKSMDSLRTANALSEGEKRKYRRIIHFLEQAERKLYTGDAKTVEEGFGQVKERFDSQVSEMKEIVASTKGRLHALFSFTQKAFGEENEMLILVTGLTVNTSGARFIGMFGSEDYQKYNGKLRLSKRQEDLRQEIEKLKL